MALRESVAAVLTGDIVNSTAMTTARERALLTKLKKALPANQTSFYRGDSFQVFLKEAERSLRTALICRTLAISLTDGDEVRGDIRIGIGVGKVRLPVRIPEAAQGEAFVLSGRGLDEIEETEEQLSIRSGHALADIGFEVMANYLDAIYRDMTGKQAVVLLGLLQGQTQQHIASKIKKSQSTVSQLANAGRWPEIARLLQQFEMLINQIK
jgi:hypothetical protein